MNKFTYAAFSLLMGVLIACSMLLSFTARFIAGILTIGFLFATMIKLVVFISFKKIYHATGLSKIQLSAPNNHVEYAR